MPNSQHAQGSRTNTHAAELQTLRQQQQQIDNKYQKKQTQLDAELAALQQQSEHLKRSLHELVRQRDDAKADWTDTINDMQHRQSANECKTVTDNCKKAATDLRARCDDMHGMIEQILGRLEDVTELQESTGQLRGQLAAITDWCGIDVYRNDGSGYAYKGKGKHKGK